MDQQKEIEKMILNHRRWINGALSEIASVVKLKKDVEHYMHMAARAEKSLESLERRVKELEK